MEYFDIVDEDGIPTGKTISRETAHSKGVLHRTAHVWVIRKTPCGYDVLLQKRSLNKDSFPGLYDTSSAGHIPAGDKPLSSALRELHEELGVLAESHQLHYVGVFRIQYEREFHGVLFRDNEVAFTYVYWEPIEIEDLALQDAEVSEVRWFDVDYVWNELQSNQNRFCVPPEGLRILMEYISTRTAR